MGKLVEPEPKLILGKKYELLWECVDAPGDYIKGINWRSKTIIKRSANNLIDVNMPSDIEKIHKSECKAKTHKISYSMSLVDTINFRKNKISFTKTVKQTRL